MLQSDVEEIDSSNQKLRHRRQQEPRYWCGLHRPRRWSDLQSSRRDWMETSRNSDTHDVRLLYAYSRAYVVTACPSDAFWAAATSPRSPRRDLRRDRARGSN